VSVACMQMKAVLSLHFKTFVTNYIINSPQCSLWETAVLMFFRTNESRNEKKMKSITKRQVIQKRIVKDVLEFKWAIICLVIYYLLTNDVFHAFCPMVIATGLPCPGCGVTRSIFYLLTGQISRSFALSPFALFWILLGVWFVYERYVQGKKVKGIYPLIGCIFVAMMVYYVYRMYTAFPFIPPMIYREDNVLNNLLELR